MKKIVCTIMAAAALAACTKSEVQYDAPQEIGFAPATKNITKAEGKSGTLATELELGVWAYWDKDGAVENYGVANYSVYDDNYLVNALFANKGNSWGGSPNGYPWPVNGSLVFAGYTTPNDNVLANDNAVKYDLTSDVMTFTGYENTNEFDLCWFGRTANSYNNRADGTAVDVTLSHALTWVSVAVYGEGTPVNNWTITSMTLKNVATAGTATCTGSTKKATWSANTVPTNGVNIYTNGTHVVTAGTTNGSTTTGVKLTDNVLIPSNNVQLTVEYKFPVNGVDKTDSKTLTLNDTTWESGVHYTYTLHFKGNEILVAPTYGAWTTSDQTITVE